MVLATAWGSKFGGINSFSTDFCVALARVLSQHKVVCLCFSGTHSECDDAKAKGVTLLPINSDCSSISKQDLAKKILDLVGQLDAISIEWWVGHDAITGEIALACANEHEKSKSAVLMHMSYEDYSYVKHAPDKGAIVAERIAFQQRIIRSADFAFAVGPLLFQRLKELRDSKSYTMLVPGLSEVGPVSPPSERIHGITFGRFESEEFLTKQAPLAVAAFARATWVWHESRNQQLMDSHLQVIGAPPDVISTLRTLGEKEAHRLMNLKAIDFIDDRTQLRNLLHDSNLCLMLSWHEGFGLSAWEAIGAGVPVIISKNSGVFRLLHSIGGAATGCISSIDIKARGDGQPNEEDIEETKRAILEIASDIPKAQANAKSLRKMLRFQYNFTWDQTAQDFAKALGIPTTTTLLDRSSIFDARVLTESTDVTEGFEIAAAHRLLRLAEGYHFSGEYLPALKVLDGLKTNNRSLRISSIAMDATLIEAEVYLRLNKYPKARTLLEKVASEAAERSDWTRFIRAKSIENAILRDLGLYDLAVDLAKDLLQVAEREHVSGSIEKIHRTLARSFALSGRWDIAVTHGTIALESARTRHDGESEAKAALALGEAYRHGLDQVSAIEWYTKSRDLAGQSGNVDCFLWAGLGLADSLFLLKEFPHSSDTIMRLKNYVEAHAHPLESLHTRLSELSIALKNGEDVIQKCDQLCTEYKILGIDWPGAYFSALKQGDYTHPKRF